MILHLVLLTALYLISISEKKQVQILMLIKKMSAMKQSSTVEIVKDVDEEAAVGEVIAYLEQDG